MAFLKAVEKAKRRLNLAGTTLAELDACNNYDQFDLFEQKWYVFLSATKAIYTILEQGAKEDAGRRQWFGGIANQRRQDPLLQYMFQARNDNEHGIDLVADRVDGIWGVGMPSDIDCWIEFKLGEKVNGVHAIEDFKSSHGGFVTSAPGAIILTKVVGRDKKVYLPPTEHKGLPLADCSPIGVANATFDFLSNVMAEASTWT